MEETKKTMELTVGAILEGKIKSITNFGAFVSLPENKTGMVHNTPKTGYPPYRGEPL